jgi:hypothetical protein
VGAHRVSELPLSKPLDWWQRAFSDNCLLGFQAYKGWIMTDKELIEQARKWPADGFGEGLWFNAMADRIEALLIERDDYILKQKVWEEANDELRTAHIAITRRHQANCPVGGNFACTCGADSQSQTESRPLAPDLGEKSAKHDAAVTDKAGERGLGSAVFCGVCNIPMTQIEPGKWQHTGECQAINPNAIDPVHARWHRRG